MRHRGNSGGDGSRHRTVDSGSPDPGGRPRPLGGVRVAGGGGRRDRSADVALAGLVVTQLTGSRYANAFASALIGVMLVAAANVPVRGCDRPGGGGAPGPVAGGRLRLPHPSGRPAPERRLPKRSSSYPRMTPLVSWRSWDASRAAAAACPSRSAA